MKKQVFHQRLPIVLSLLAFVLPAFTAHGQTVIRNQDYYRDVISLSETLGKAHSVRVACNGRDDQYWRTYMQRLLELEAPYQGGLRRSMVNGFNAGFSTGRSYHALCTQATVDAEKTYAMEGQVLANRLTAGNMPGYVSPDSE